MLSVPALTCENRIVEYFCTILMNTIHILLDIFNPVCYIFVEWFAESFKTKADFAHNALFAKNHRRNV